MACVAAMRYPRGGLIFPAGRNVNLSPCELERSNMSMLKGKQVVELSREQILMFVERIVNEIFPKETGASRLQQIGLFTLIYALQGKPPVTAARIAQITRQSPSQISRQLKKLLDLKRTETRNKQGRGHALELTIRDTPQTRRLTRAIAKAAVARVGTARKDRKDVAQIKRSKIPRLR
jgi:DNA-binding transcriptional ArsR family regulator